MTYEDPIFAFDVEDMQTAFYVYIAGIMISVNVFILEIIVKIISYSISYPDDKCRIFRIEFKKPRLSIFGNRFSYLSSRNIWQVDD